VDMVEHAERMPLMRAWQDLTNQGSAELVARLIDWPVPARLVAFDLRERHGVYVIVLWPADTHVQLNPHGGTEGLRQAPLVARVTKNERAQITAVDPAATAMLGLTADDMVGHPSLEFIHPDDQPVAVDSWLQMMAESGPVRRVRIRHRCGDGTWKWLEMANQNLLGDPERPCVLTDIVDITEEMSAHEAVRERQQLLDRLTQALPVGVLQIDADGNAVFTNDRLGEILGQQPNSLAELVHCTAPADRHLVDLAVRAVLGENADRDVQVRVVGEAEGRSLRLCELNIRPLTNESAEVSGAIFCVADVTEGVRLRNELERRASTDELTGCANRRSVMAGLDDLAAQTQSDRPTGLAVVYLDLDGFKAVNDTFGHSAGDEVLVVAARRLSAAVRSCDRLGRLGGDEFLVACPGVPSASDAAVIAQRLSSAISGPVTVAGQDIILRASVGVAWTDVAVDDADTLVRAADTAMYRCKAGDGPSVVVVGGPAAA
jgi:diguanylate cyclase (GGDEF)-like protein/PAS domain S-box-containing protein